MKAQIWLDSIYLSFKIDLPSEVEYRLLIRFALFPITMSGSGQQDLRELRQPLFENLAADIGQSEIASLIAMRQFQMVHPK